MRERVTIQSHTSARDASGQPVATWSDLMTEQPANKIDVRGGGTYRGTQLQETIDVVFEMRWRRGVLPDMRIVHDGQTYNITRVSNVENVRRYMTIFASAVIA